MKKGKNSHIPPVKNSENSNTAPTKNLSKFGESFMTIFNSLKNTTEENKRTTLIYKLEDILYKAEDDGGRPAIESLKYNKMLNDYLKDNNFSRTGLT